MEKVKIISLILMVLGIIPLLIVLIKRWMIKAFMKKTIITTATVTNCEKRHGLKGSVYYILSLQYETIDGKEIINGTMGFTKQEKGDRIPLMYLPDKPTQFSIDFGKKIPLAIVLTLVFFGLIVWFCIWLNSLKYTSQ